MPSILDRSVARLVCFLPSEVRQVARLFLAVAVLCVAMAFQTRRLRTDNHGKQEARETKRTRLKITFDRTDAQSSQ